MGLTTLPEIRDARFEQIATTMREHVPMFYLRVRERYIEGVAGMIAAEVAGEVQFSDMDKIERVLAVLGRLPTVLAKIREEHAATRSRFDELLQLISDVDHSGERHQLLVDYLRATSPAKTLRGDLRALNRNLGVAVLRERMLAQQHVLATHAEVAWAFVAAAFDALGGPLRKVIHGYDRLISEAIAWAKMGFWTLRARAMAAISHLLSGLSLGHGQVQKTREIVFATLDDEQAHPWLQAAAMDLAAAMDKEFALAYARLRLLQPRAQEHDFVACKLLLRFHQRWSSDEMKLRTCAALLKRGALKDAVLCELVVSLRDVDRNAGLALLATVDDDVWRGSEAASAEALQTLAAWVEGALSPQWLAQWRRILSVSPGSTATAAVAKICTDLAKQGVSESELLPLLAADQSGNRHRLATAAERVRAITNPQRRNALADLRGLLNSMPLGSRKRFSPASLPATVRSLVEANDGVAIGRLLALVAAEDWGCAASIRGGRLILWRGDHMKTRAWRLAHELRHPAPNKRQGYRHTVGRKGRGQLRAHPAWLDEATATTVPGERIHVDSQGSWGPYLPTVDDVLDLSLRGTSTQLFTSLGVTTITPPPTLWARLRLRARVTKRYQRLFAQRQASYAASEDKERAKYLEQLSALGVSVTFTTYEQHASLDLIDERIASVLRYSQRETQLASAVFPVVPAAASPITDAGEWFQDNESYLYSLQENSQLALALFATAFLVLFFVYSFRMRLRLARARGAIPLSIGGWGTRGKSGTERLKAGVFSGLGVDVFAKTTGCEAMFLYGTSAQPAVEIFLYRPYDKATIWEQRNMIEAAAGLQSDVFLWECMALTPRYVGILQHDWMRDDLVTLTNAYPDHEDIQGPAGIDVARTIGTFIPENGQLVTSEVNFKPLFDVLAKQRNTMIDTVGDLEAGLLPQTILSIFPYQEHPRNISLVARMAETIGIDPELAVYAMADNVVADLGVLKLYPEVTARGRRVKFLNCCSANERTGLMNSWQRMGLHKLDADETPAARIVGVINNRADRISRSEVFARIMARDVAVDAYVLIGTNIDGLRGYLDNALQEFLAEVVVASDGDDGARIASRIKHQLARLRIPSVTAEQALTRWQIYARGCGVVPAETEKLVAALEEALGAEVADLPAAKRVAAGEPLKRCLEAVDTLEQENDRPLEDCEVLAPPPLAEAIAHFQRELARLVAVASELRRAASKATPEAKNESFRQLYSQLFFDKIESVDDANVKGDTVVDACLSAVPPGCETTLVGMQNIKGTGLDFVYRWISLETVVGYVKMLSASSHERRADALRALLAHADYGALDSGFALQALRRRNQGDGPKAMQIVDVGDAEEVKQLQKIHDKAKAKMSHGVEAAGWLARVVSRLESMFDIFHSVYRYHKSKRILHDYSARRISSGDAQRIMRDIVASQKGGWLSLRKRNKSDE